MRSRCFESLHSVEVLNDIIELPVSDRLIAQQVGFVFRLIINFDPEPSNLRRLMRLCFSFFLCHESTPHIKHIKECEIRLNVTSRARDVDVDRRLAHIPIKDYGHDLYPFSVYVDNARII